jgi:hypothetical protein
MADPVYALAIRRASECVGGLDVLARRLNISRARLNLYAEAGADLLFADAAMSVEDIGTLAKSVSKPLSVNMGFGIRQRSTTPLLSAKQLQDLGVSVVIYPRMLTACALMGMRRGLELLQQSLDSGEVVDRPDALVSFEELHGIMGMHEIEDMEQRFLTPEQLETKYGHGRKASIMPDARPTKVRPLRLRSGQASTSSGRTDRCVIIAVHALRLSVTLTFLI